MAIWQSLESGVQIREDYPRSLLRVDTTKVNRREFEQQLLRQGTKIDKTWMEDRYAVFRVETTGLKYPQFFDPIPEPKTETEFGVFDTPTGKFLGKSPPEELMQPPRQPTQFQGEASASQLIQLRKFAEDRGATLIEGEPMSTQQGVVHPYTIISGDKDLLADKKFKRETEEIIFGEPSMKRPEFFFTDENKLEIPIKDEKQIQKEKQEIELRSAAERTVREKPIPSQIRTVLSPEGYGYVGRVSLEQLATTQPLLSPLLLQGTTSTERVIQKIESQHRKQLQGQTQSSRLIEAGIEAVQSPPMELTLSFLGGYGITRAGSLLSTKVSSTAIRTVGKGIGLGVGSALGGARAYDIGLDITQGKIDEALGKSIISLGSISTGALGSKMASVKIAKMPTQKTIELQNAKVKGVSVTTEYADDIASSKIGLDIELKIGKKSVVVGAKAESVGKALSSKTGKQTYRIEIPKQTVDNINIPKTELEGFGDIFKLQKGFYRVKTSEGVIFKDAADDFVLAGTTRGKGYARLEKEIKNIKLTDIPIEAKISSDAPNIKIKLSDIKGQKGETYTFRKYVGKTVIESGDVDIKDIGRTIKLISEGAKPKKLNVPINNPKITGTQEFVFYDISKQAKITATKPFTTKIPTQPKGLPINIKQQANIPVISKITGQIKATGTSASFGQVPKISLPTIVSSASTSLIKEATEIKTYGMSRVEPKQSTKTKQKTKKAIISLPKTSIATMQQIKQKTRSATKTKLMSISIPINIQDLEKDQTLKRLQSTKYTPTTKQATKQKTITHIPTIPPIPTVPTEKRVPAIRLPSMAVNLSFPKTKKRKYGTVIITNPIPKSLVIKLPKIKGV